MFNKDYYFKIEKEIAEFNSSIGKELYYIEDQNEEWWICKKFKNDEEGQCYFSFTKDGCNFKSMRLFYNEWVKESINYDEGIDTILKNILSRKKRLNKLLEEI